jgi:hypothetical protein
MNRSLHRLAVLGLLVLGASTAGAQTYPTLFNVTYQPSNLTLTITATGNAASGNLPAGTSSYSLGYGVLLKNLFTAYPDAISDNASGQLYASVLGGLQGKIQRVGTSLSDASSNGLLSDVYDQQSGTGLSILSNDFGYMFFNKSDSVTAAFNTANSLTITFASSAASTYLPTVSAANAGFVNIGAGAGIDIGSYSYTYSAVPEPSTYAAIAGALGLGYAVYRRRRQAAASTTATA